MNKNRRPSKLTTIKRFRPLLMFLILALSVFIPAHLTRSGIFGIGEEATMELFGVVATALGAIFVVYELNDSERINRCDTLFNLNMNFVENERFMRLYQELSKCVQDPEYKLVIDNEDPNAIHSGDLMGYMTFYEVINEFISQGVLDVKQMDDLFGDRFFKLIHNDYVQEHELYSEPSSYVNIFELYEAWTNYRNFEAAESETRLVVLRKNAIPALYTKKKLYLRESMQFFYNRDNIPFTNSKGETISLRLHRLLPKDLQQVLALQKQIVDNIDPAIFEQSSEEEILESMLIDYCYGLFDGNTLAAICICVMNRQTKQARDEHERNLCELTDTPHNYGDFVTFDTIQVAPRYRGFGIQSFFLKEAEKIVVDAGAKHIIATVSPDNPYSKNMFMKAGYSVYNNTTIDIYGSSRYLVCKTITGADDELS